MIFDSHAHYDDDWFDGDREELLKSFPENGIEYVMNIGADMETSKNTIELTRKYPFLYGAVGVHPSGVGEMTEKDRETLREWSGLDKIQAIGEIGLDYHYDAPSRELQKKWFEAQMELAKEINLPMVVHSRDAALETYEMMKTCDAGKVGGVVHCFSYTKEMAAKFLDMGFYIGVGGVLTFKNAKKLKEVVEYIPLDRILLETDCPYLAPEPFRGKRNYSLYLPYVLDEMAKIKGRTREEVAEITKQNALKMYRI